MAQIEKTVFISYRRTDVYTALAVYENLKNQGYDVFFDYTSISSGDFEQIITSNIKARAHFILILTPTALDRCSEPGDWLRREIELAIDEKRNIVPLFFKGFRFGTSPVNEKLTGKLKNISRYNGLNVHEDYFQEAMQRVRTQFLSRPLDTVLHPVSTEVRKVVREEQVAADKALEQIENVNELVKQPEEKPDISKIKLVPVEVPKEKSKETKRTKPVPVVQRRKLSNFKKVFSQFDLYLIARIASGLVLIALFIWFGTNVLHLPTSTPEPTYTLQPTIMHTFRPTVTPTFQPAKTNTPSPTETLIPTLTSIPLTTLGIGSTMTGEDGMTLLYVPAGGFTMGSDNGNPDEKPIHIVSLDAYWVDRTEVTNKMYSLCVNASVCKEPPNKYSNTYSSYYGNAEFDNYPVIFVDWNMAKTYCEWTGRRLPTEAEWEKAARGEYAFTYPWGNDLPNNNWLNYNNVVGDTTQVDKYPEGVSIYGLLDMAGNVEEWVNDWYSDTYYDSSPQSNPLGPNLGTYRVLRGGSWFFSVIYIRSASRVRGNPSQLSFLVGFRCAMSATP